MENYAKLIFLALTLSKAGVEKLTFLVKKVGGAYNIPGFSWDGNLVVELVSRQVSLTNTEPKEVHDSHPFHR